MPLPFWVIIENIWNKDDHQRFVFPLWISQIQLGTDIQLYF